MDKDQSRSTETATLRHLAEERALVKTAKVQPPRTESETLRLVHELEVHQIELEMQNAELNQARDEQETVLEKYTDLYDFAPVGYFTLDHDGVVRAVNLTGASLLGIERTQLVGSSFGLFVAVEARHAFTTFLGRVFTSPTKEACEVALLKGGKLPLFVQLEAVAAASGLECRVAIIDISLRRQLEEKLEILHTELEGANRELETFNYTVAHDLRKPLTVVNGYCQAIREECGNTLNETCKEYLRKAYDGTLRMNQLIDALLDFSRLAHVKTHREQVDLSTLAHEIACDLQMAEPERRVRFLIADGLSTVGDVALLRVVLNNLLGNAWKFTGSREEGIIEFGTTEVAGKPTWFVRDNGAGFHMADAAKLFAPFQRLPGAEECKGFGIGLATVERIIQRHGGRVWAEGAPGNGATFYFILTDERIERRMHLRLSTEETHENTDRRR